MAQATVINLSDPSNGGKAAIAAAEPYTVHVTLEGTADLLFHRWTPEAVQAKSAAAKNSAAKKMDDIESYVWRTERGEIALPGEYVRQAIILAAKFRQDPRSPRKSAMDLFKAGLASLTPLASLGRDRWDYEDCRRVVVQRAGVNRTRPAMRSGWKAELDLMVLLPEYIDRHLLHEVAATAGRLIGVGDFRPTYGRFAIVQFA